MRPTEDHAKRDRSYQPAVLRTRPSGSRSGDGGGGGGAISELRRQRVGGAQVVTHLMTGQVTGSAGPSRAAGRTARSQVVGEGSAEAVLSAATALLGQHDGRRGGRGRQVVGPRGRARRTLAGGERLRRRRRRREVGKPPS